MHSAEHHDATPHPGHRNSGRPRGFPSSPAQEHGRRAKYLPVQFFWPSTSVSTCVGPRVGSRTLSSARSIRSRESDRPRPIRRGRAPRARPSAVSPPGPAPSRRRARAAPRASPRARPRPSSGAPRPSRAPTWETPPRRGRTSGRPSRPRQSLCGGVRARRSHGAWTFSLLVSVARAAPTAYKRAKAARVAAPVIYSPVAWRCLSVIDPD